MPNSALPDPSFNESRRRETRERDGKHWRPGEPLPEDFHPDPVAALHRHAQSALEAHAARERKAA